MADVHCREDGSRYMSELFATVAEDAEVLVIPGDITDHGRVEEAVAVMDGLAHVEVPIVTVLGNHDHESGHARTVVKILMDGGVHCLDRTSITIDGVGFAGVKGFCGGFGKRSVRGFGEDALKAFIRESEHEADALLRELETLPEGPRVAVTHYSPVPDTVRGEPPEIFPFLGTSLLEDALDEAGATIAFHGHAHKGTFEGTTRGGTPVRNVARHVLKHMGHPKPYYVFDVA